MDEQMLFQLAGLLPTRARSPPRAARETRHMSSAPENGLAIFSGSRSCRCLYVVSAQIAGRGPHAHIPCPGLCWCRGLGRRRAQRLPASCHEAAPCFALGCLRRPLPRCSRAAGYVARADRVRVIGRWRLAGRELAPAFGRPGRFPAHLQLRVGGDHRRLWWLLSGLLVEFR